ncbi:autotransporter outer membrane beta-barrel domain-containing protein [Flagellimonas hymeniacidonis]|uniref:Autotransporter outer membrane beta-barrel domain-containing protein n=1 Tax=Flagellimonas hymeniacidonis TaxID=2603628 RepID=A0A5C8V942_9FLAO|nr:autotransporter outer membrane beta-barrel domain-containing protein [Flagellimonas hymeniacidonis]TXN37689.1 autotransporter outer membrane beta-barrel domain-containing protein [Flagellimonas hymeniacidonis]
MKISKTRLFVLAIFALIFTLPVNSQNNRPPTRVEMVESIHDAFRDVVKNAIGPNKSNEPCVAHLKDIIANDKGTLHALRTNLLISVKDVQRSLIFDSEVSGVELGPFKDYTDKAIFAFHNTSNFDAFVEYFTDKSANRIDDSTKNELKDYYNNYLTNNEVDWFVESRQKYTSDYLCNRSYHFEANIKEWNYPKALWDIKISAEISCDCVSDNDRFVDEAKYEYRATAKGSFTGKVMTMEKPENPALKILSLNCCSQKKDEENSRLQQDISSTSNETDRDDDGINDVDDDCPDYPGPPKWKGCPEPDTDGDGLLDSDDECPKVPGIPELRGCPQPDADGDGIPDHWEEEVPNTKVGSSNTVNEPDTGRDGVKNKNDPWFETEKNDIDFDYSWGQEAFSITIGGGPTIGDEADFFGFSYSAEMNYARRVSNRLRLLGGVGYTRYTGKETDFGFETEGESFIPITAKANYKLSDAFGAEAGLGYAISTGGGEGGITYSVGPFWRPLEAVLIALNYVNISFGEGSLGALMLSGRFSLSKK